MDRGLLTGVVFIDLRKAFDTVDHVSPLLNFLIMVLKTRSFAGWRAICFIECKLYHMIEPCQKVKLFPVEYRKDSNWAYCFLPYS